MSLFVDDMERSVSGDGTQLRDELVGVLRDVREQGCFVRMVTINGSEIAVRDIPTYLFSNSDEVVVVTCSLDELIEDTMYSVKEYTPKLVQAFTESTRLFRMGNVGEAAGTFSETLRGLHWTYDVLRDLAGLHPGPSPVHEVREETDAIMPQLLGAWESHDYVLLADVVEYELLPVLEKWTRVADLFASQMQVERLKQGVFPKQ